MSSEVVKNNRLISRRALQIEAALAQCPSTKLVASGYSQGGQIVHNAIGLLPAATAAWISKVVIFGDPGTSLLEFWNEAELITR